MGIRIINRAGTVLAMAAGAFVGAIDSDAADAAPLSCAEQSVGDSFNSRDSRQDLDADGNSDLVVGVPDWSTTGAVDIHYAAYGTSGYGTDSPRAGMTQRIGQGFFGGLPGFAGRPRIGAAIAFGDFNGDFCEDLAIGAPGADEGRGAVEIGFGSPTGISPTGAILIHGNKPGEHFGSAVVARNRDVWIGAPDRPVGSVPGAGAIYHYRISMPPGSGVNLAHLRETITEASPEVPGVPEADDHFGQVLAGGERFRKVTNNFFNDEPVVVVGEPDEDVQGRRNAGSVTVIDSLDESGHIQFARTITAASAGISGAPAAGDHFGATVSESGAFVAVGVPGRDIGRAPDAGAVHVVNLKGSALRQVGVLTQNRAGIPGTAEAGDRFGASVLFYGCASGFAGGNRECLAMGAPGEGIGTAHHAGVVDFAVLHLGSVVRLTGDLAALRQGPPGPGSVGGTAESGDQLGAGLSALSLPSGIGDGGDTTFHGGASLVVAVPGEDRGGVHNSGILLLTDGATRTVPDNFSDVVADSAGATAGERYGVGASTTDNGPAVYITPE